MLPAVTARERLPYQRIHGRLTSPPTCGDSRPPSDRRARAWVRSDIRALEGDVHHADEIPGISQWQLAPRRIGKSTGPPRVGTRNCHRIDWQPGLCHHGTWPWGPRNGSSPRSSGSAGGCTRAPSRSIPSPSN